LRLSAAALCAAFVGSLPQVARADAVSSAQGDLQEVGRELPSVRAAVEYARKTAKLTPEQRLANGELFYRLKDYRHAIVLLNEILVDYQDTPSYPDALWLLGETYYDSGDYLAANRAYKELVTRGSEPRFEPYFGKALARMVDVTIRINAPLTELAFIFEKFNLVPPAQVDAALFYAKGKAYFRQKSWNEAAQSFAQVTAGTYLHQARYYQALVALKVAQGPSGEVPIDDDDLPSEGSTSGSQAAPNAANKGVTSGNFKQAIEAFRAVTTLAPDSPEHQHVIDLAWMAVARLFYQMEQYGRAAEAYGKVGHGSPERDTMLYELGWVYVRMGDVQRAEHALELLMVNDPDSEYIGDGTLLRADLLLRAGAFNRALELYKSVLAQYDPLRAKVDAFLDSTKDVSVYYDRLAQQQLDVLDQADQVPPLALKWAREKGDGPLAFAVIDGVNDCKLLIHQSNELVEKLSALLSEQNKARVKAFPELRAGEETALTLLNRIARDRLALARELDGEESGDMGGEMGQVRQERRALMDAVSKLPASSDDFVQREKDGVERWNKLSQNLTRTTMQIDALQATVNGLRKMLADGPQWGVARDPAKVASYQAEIDLSEKELKQYRETAAEMRRQIEIGRAQIGLGDQRYQDDNKNRSEFIAKLEREVQLASGGAAGGGAQRFASQIGPILAMAREYEAQLSSALGDLQNQVATRSAELQQQVEAQRTALAGYQATLSALDGQAHDLVGQVAKENFGKVRKRLRDIVLRADVGVTEQAWEVREEELSRVQSLQVERNRQEKLLDDELKEVKDDDVEPGQAGNNK
jgi:tetratricopeptide (TPR) repeat protein